MTLQEFSDEFDILYNNIMSNQAPGLTEYEKSVFLTKAQDDLVRDYFNSRVDNAEGGFDGSQKRQYDFSQLLKVVELNKSTNNSISKIDNRSILYEFPDDYFLSVNETITNSNTIYSVVAITYNDYQRLLGKPYAYPPKRMAWRLFNSLDDTQVVAEIIGRFSSTDLTYSLRYVQKLSPIILVDLKGTGVSIGNKQDPINCVLPSQAHQEILERAVTLAKIAYQGGTTQTLAAASNKQQQ